ncbi:pantoate--beta-alanine ligase [Paenibacillus sp. CAA11]|uniref:pantoate--beta-alanine ligase n=1 Tax=Paenibacillus sp. CAA11 TaxID=1532905 RepID=UPI000D357747|nr:pantoate--beta-alanine ligase [Paenibacillus sp. CAA11]AWB44980.1 pantoate--beta-alanine ligase [Paenibacillus sp. CAA11]
MIQMSNPAELRSAIKEERFKAAREGKELKVGLVPTMGYLHEGHASLLRKAREENDLVVLSIFVNPIQFGPNEDLDRYPRDLERDQALAKREGVDIIFAPGTQDMYPTPTKTKVQVAELTTGLCGAARPGHFDGVTTVVSKLLHLASPDRAYFGLKDAQQLAVLSQMVRDLNMDVELVPCPIVREADGLALSSRNVYLTAEQREEALVLSRSLFEARKWYDSGESITPREIRRRMHDLIAAQPLAEIDYIEIVSFPSLEPLAENTAIQELTQPILLALAVKFGGTRLIDNILLHSNEVPVHV